MIVEAEPLNETSTPAEVDKESKEIRVTQSQLLNEKKEVIIPIYKRKNVIILFIILIFLISGSVFLKHRFSKPEAQKHP